MLDLHNKRERMHLINLIARRSGKTPNFALLIGAGSSSSSGVKTANQMIIEWRQQMYLQSKSSKPTEEWLREQDWFEDDEEYSILFEKVYDQPSQRRIYIEECVKGAKPSWGYIYLSNIIANNFFNAIFTPNFDDLLNEACFLYADQRPIVCAHDSAVAEIRVTSARPKIIKVHGDFLYDSIKNTIRETETLEKNMRDKFMQFSREYGLVVIGYGGNDRSIMDILDMMLRTDGYFPNGIYWCKREGDKISKKLNRLLRRENIFLIEIEGFDEFMAELHQGLGLTLPDVVRDPYKATTERLNTFISPKKEIRNPIIKAGIAELEKQVKTFEQIISGSAPKGEFDGLVPYLFLGDLETENDNYLEALAYYDKALIQKPDNLEIMVHKAIAYNYTEKFNEALELSEKMIKLYPTDPSGYYQKGESFFYLKDFNNSIESYKESLKYTEDTEKRIVILVAISNALLSAEKWNEVLSKTEEVLKISSKDYMAIINKCFALKKLDKKPEATNIIQNFLPGIKNAYLRACAFAILDDKEKMLKELKKAIKEDGSLRIDAKFDFVFVDYREDPDFQKLINKVQE